MKPSFGNPGSTFHDSCGTRQTHCLMECAGAMQAYRRLMTLICISSQYGLDFFRMMLELYESLATLHRQRVNVATEWLQVNGHIELKRTHTSSRIHLSGLKHCRFGTRHKQRWCALSSRWRAGQTFVRSVVTILLQTTTCPRSIEPPAVLRRFDFVWTV